MRRSLAIVVSLFVIAGLALTAWACWTFLAGGESEWTTRSPAALKEFLAGFDNLSRHYFYDAVASFERALELDPQFVAAKLFIAEVLPYDYSERGRLFEDLRQVDLDRLSRRERFLVDHALARHDGEDERAERLLRAYLADHPEDTYAIREDCLRYWEAQDWDEAEACYRHLSKLDPDWVEAHNRLGYIALARGRFAEAEEQFLSYRFVAHDLAAPYESLGQLYLLRGRYEDAEEAVDEALRIKPDYCSAYVIRARLESLQGELAQALATLDELAAVPTCAYYEELGRLCPLRAWLKYQQGDLEGAWEEVSGACLERQEGFDATAYRIAVMTGRSRIAEEMRRALDAKRQRAEALGKPVYAGYYAALQSYAEGVERLAARDYGEAAGHFRQADDRLGYWVGDLAGFKLFNRLNLLRALELGGRQDEAAALRAEVEAINPRLLEEFRFPDFESLSGPPR